MRKILPLVALCLMAALCLSACSLLNRATATQDATTGTPTTVPTQTTAANATTPPAGVDAPPVGEPLRKTETSYTFYNSYAGLTVTIPEGWYIASLDQDNLSADKDATKSLAGLEGSDMGDGGYYFPLISAQNRRQSNDGDHAEFTLYLEEYPDIDDFDEYLEYTAQYLLMSDDDGAFLYEQIDDGEVVLNGKTYAYLDILVTITESGDEYVEKYLIAPVGPAANGVYLTAYANYWADSDQSLEDAEFMLENFFQVNG